MSIYTRFFVAESADKRTLLFDSHGTTCSVQVALDDPLIVGALAEVLNHPGSAARFEQAYKTLRDAEPF